MQKTVATVLLIILNVLGEALIILLITMMLSTVSSRFRISIYVIALALAVLDMPIMFVYRKFRDKYKFSKEKFFLCTLIAPFVPAIIFSVVIYKIGVQNSAVSMGYSGLAGLAFAVILMGATIFLAVCTIVWTELSDLFERR